MVAGSAAASLQKSVRMKSAVNRRLKFKKLLYSGEREPGIIKDMDGFFVKLKPHKTFMLRALERLFFTKITNKCLGSAGFSVDTAKPETSVSEELRLVMGNIKYAGRARESAWRRMAGTAWDAPKDPSIYGFLDVEAGPIERRIAQLRAQGEPKLPQTLSYPRPSNILAGVAC